MQIQFNKRIQDCSSQRQNSMPKMQKIKIQNANSIEKSIQYFEIGCIQFNKIFIQLGNSGFDQGYIENKKDCKGIF